MIYWKLIYILWNTIKYNMKKFKNEFKPMTYANFVCPLDVLKDVNHNTYNRICELFCLRSATPPCWARPLKNHFPRWVGRSWRATPSHRLPVPNCLSYQMLLLHYWSTDSSSRLFDFGGHRTVLITLPGSYHPWWPRGPLWI